MKPSKQNLFFLLCFLPFWVMAQYEFSGKVDGQHLEGTIYLSVVENYRQLSGVYPEQILNKTSANKEGNFIFRGDNLSQENKMYRIHIDACNDTEALENHFTGHCVNSQEVVFIANNTTTIYLPFSFENEMFCSVVSNNKSAQAFLKIDSLKADMRFAFGTYRSEANRALNSKKWFNTFQNYGENLNEPLAELYSYAFLSDRRSNLYGYYLEDVQRNPYYDALLKRLDEKYPSSAYTAQYKSELEADKILVAPHTKNNVWLYLLCGVLGISLLANAYYFNKVKNIQKVASEKQPLSAQEQKIAALILDNKSNKEIAEVLFISVSTVKTHINNIYKKQQVSSRDDLKSVLQKNST